MAAASLLAALVEKWATVVPNLPSLFLGEIPESNPNFLPTAHIDKHSEKTVYATIKGLTDPATQTAKPNQINGSFEIVIFQSGTSTKVSGGLATDQIAQQVMGALLPGSLELTTGQLTIWRGDYRLEATQLRDKEDNPVYKATIPYTAFIGGPAV